MQLFALTLRRAFLNRWLQKRTDLKADGGRACNFRREQVYQMTPHVPEILLRVVVLSH